jgi:hypothetical protein
MFSISFMKQPKQRFYICLNRGIETWVSTNQSVRYSIESHFNYFFNNKRRPTMFAQSYVHASGSLDELSRSVGL